MSRTHIAIMNSQFKFTKKILDGEKTIESRWYKNKYPPIGKINPKDIIYFKEGKYITASSKVKDVKLFENLREEDIKSILNSNFEKLGIEESDIPYFYELFKKKKYCILIYLKDIKKEIPFLINKKGFGSMSSWIIVDKIVDLKI